MTFEPGDIVLYVHTRGRPVFLKETECTVCTVIEQDRPTNVMIQAPGGQQGVYPENLVLIKRKNKKTKKNKYLLLCNES